MQPVFAWGMEVVRGLQGFLGPVFLVPMKVITFFGSEVFVLASLPLLYWCVDRRKGARLAILVLLSSFVNLWLKALTMWPRPYDFDPSVGFASDPTSAFPSGHSQTSATFWGGMLDILPRRLGLVLAIVLPLLVGLSRVYLGVHFPTDVLAGWTLGALIVVGHHFLGGRVEKFLARYPAKVGFWAAAAVAVGMNLLMPKDTAVAGAFFGGSAGFAFASSSARFSTSGKPAAKVLRYLLGMAGTLVLYLGPKLLIGEAFPEQAALIRFLRYALVGAWVAYGAPRVFLLLKLAEPEAVNSTSPN